MNTFYKSQSKIVFLVVFTLLLQIAGPVLVVDYSYADGDEGLESGLTVEVISSNNQSISMNKVEDEKINIEWNLVIRDDDENNVYTDQADLTLKSEKSGDLISEDGKNIGTYEVFTDGLIKVSVNEDLYGAKMEVEESLREALEAAILKAEEAEKEAEKLEEEAKAAEEKLIEDKEETKTEEEKAAEEAEEEYIEKLKIAEEAELESKSKAEAADSLENEAAKDLEALEVAKEQVTETEKKLAEAEEDEVETAELELEKAEENLKEAKDKAEKAQEDLEKAKAEAQEAEESAEKAKSEAEAAEKRAEEARVKVEESKETSEDEKEESEELKEAAKEARTKAEKAREVAEEARAEVNKLKEKAEESNDHINRSEFQEYRGIIELQADSGESKEIQGNWVTEFDLTIIDKDNKQIKVDHGEELEVDIDQMNSVILAYILVKPDGVDVAEGDTYTIDLPDIFKDAEVSGKKIVDDEHGILGTYAITGKQLTITFTGNANIDDVKINVDISGEFNTEIFKTEQEVEVEVPYKDETSYSVTIKAKEQEYNGEDKKTAGFQYVLEDGEKVEVTKNPEYIDWIVRVNDNMESFAIAEVIDDLGENLEIVEDSFVVERIIRNYKNEEARRETITDFVVAYTDAGFKLDLGDIENAYDITYTTKIIRPDGGGTHTINNNARIILDNDEKKVNDGFKGTWSGDLPIIKKEGALSDNPNVINWEVKYNFGKEDLGEVILTDTLTHGEVDLESVKVYEVDVDVDGEITEKGVPLGNIIPVKTDTGMTLSDLNADGKAYYITFSSTVPVGLKGEVTNTVTDNLEPKNTDSDSVEVDTIPTGGKVGEQKVDDQGKPYIEWTITMNTNKVDVPSITVRDVFSKEHLKFDVNDGSLYELYKDGVEIKNLDGEEAKFTIADYTHTDDRKGFKLDITEAGPHEYKFVYRTYYTTLGMQQPKLANEAELVFLDGSGEGVGDPISVDYSLEGPKAGINKVGEYVLNDAGEQEIKWTVTMNTSEILLKANETTITEKFTSGNYEYIEGSLSLEPLGKDDYSLVVNDDKKGFVIKLTKDTNETLILTFRTTVDDTNNLDHKNEVTLDWQGGEEKGSHTVKKRDPGSKKSGKVFINDDGTKTVNWTIDFNTNKNVLHDFKLVDTYTPKTVTVSDIKITSGGTDVTDKFKISDERTGGTFTVTRDKLEAEEYKLTYSTTLSAKEEKQDIKNTAAITYIGGSENPSKTIKSPTLGVKKEAVGKVEKTDEGDFINWEITANTDTENHLVNLVNPILTDTIPSDQKLVEGSIKVERVNSGEDENIDITQQVDFVAEDNNFTIDLPDGPYQYIVTFRTQILEYPSVTPDNKDKKDRISEYENYTTLENKDYEPVSDDAWIDYFADGTNNNNAKTAKVNDDTENIDWEATVNPLGLTIKNAKIEDNLSDNQTYLIDKDNKILVKSGDDELTEGESGDYILVTDEVNHSFTITFNNPIDKPITVSYSTRLNPELIGNITVTNTIKLTGGESNKKLSTETRKETTSQWFYGGGGSGRLLDFSISKVTPNKSLLKNAKFKLERVNFNGNTETVKEELITTENSSKFEKLRAGRYILTETESPEGYKLLDKPIYFAAGYTETEGEYKITIMDNEWNEADNSNATAEGNLLTVVNDYESVSQGFEASKELIGLDLTADQFDFQLLDESRNVVATANNDAEGKVIFPEQSFNEPGTYNFKMREVNGSLGGIRYDDKELNVQVIVIEGGNGLEIESVTYLDNQEFTNIYTPGETNAVIEASKILEGQNLIEGQFEFELLDSAGQVLQTVSNKSDGTITFEEITYEEVGEYDYYIREVQGDLDGITYDEREFKVTVVVTDDKEGQLHSAITKYVEGPVQFTNSYEAGPGSIVLEAEKILNGKVLLNDQFEFELVDEEDEVVQTVKNNVNGQVIFEEIEFVKEGTYKYIIREKVGDLGGITYDTTEYPVTVTVEDGGEGFLVSTASYDDGTPVFSNEYKAAPGSIVLEAEKVLEGQKLRKDQFTFTLTDESGEVIETVTNNGEGQIIFDEIKYDQVGKYTYIIKEVKGEQGGVTYDTESYTVNVNVTDDGEGNLVADANYIGGPAVFTNKYTPNPDSVVLEASKSLKGQNLRNGQFTFNLLDGSGQVIQTKKNNSNGQIIFDEITYKAAGEFNYTIVEEKGSQRGMTYDDTEYQVVVTVTDDGIGNLTATTNYGEAPAEFINIYKSPLTEITGRKVWEGGPSRKPTIELQLYRDGEEYGSSVELKDGETEYTWRNLDEMDMNGRVYKYTVDEVNTPRRYRKSISNDGLTITNRYVPPVYPPTYPDYPDPKDPEDPDTPDPTDPKDPEDPDTPDPTDPKDPEDPETPDPTEPEDPKDPEDPDRPDPTDPEDPEDPDTPEPTDPESPDPGEEDEDDPTIDIDGDTPSGGTDVDDPTIDIDGDTPTGGTDVDKPSLPKTGEVDNIFFYLTGLVLIVLGFVYRRKTA